LETPNYCHNYSALSSLEATADRLLEAKWCIELMQLNYHRAREFCWSLNAFLRALKEVLDMLAGEVQHDKDLVSWLRDQKEALRDDNLIPVLSKNRDYVVHRQMLKPNSKGHVGWTRGNGLKFGIGWDFDVYQDSVRELERYIWSTLQGRDVLGCLRTEEDGSDEYTCVMRSWHLKEFPDKEVVDLASTAWKTIASIVYKVANKRGADLGEPVLVTSDPNQYQFEIYPQKWLKQKIAKMRREYLIQDAAQ